MSDQKTFHPPYVQARITLLNATLEGRVQRMPEHTACYRYGEPDSWNDKASYWAQRGNLASALELGKRLRPGYDFTVSRLNDGLTTFARFGCARAHFGEDVGQAMLIAVLHTVLREDVGYSYGAIQDQIETVPEETPVQKGLRLRMEALEDALEEIWRGHHTALVNGGGAWKRHVEPAILRAACLLRKGPSLTRLREGTSDE